MHGNGNHREFIKKCWIGYHLKMSRKENLVAPWGHTSRGPFKKKGYREQLVCLEWMRSGLEVSSVPDIKIVPASKFCVF